MHLKVLLIKLKTFGDILDYKNSNKGKHYIDKHSSYAKSLDVNNFEQVNSIERAPQSPSIHIDKKRDIDPEEL